MTQIQHLSMRSFLHFGHKVTLFAYQDIKAVAGVEIKDAREIISEEKLFISHDTYAAFSDVFRYELLSREEFIWADADTICLRSDWNFGDYVFGFQEPFKLGNAILGYPKESLLAKRIKEEGIYQEGKSYDNLGPILLTRLVSELGLGDRVQAQETFTPIHWTDFAITYNPQRLEEVLMKIDGSHALSLANYLLKHHRFNREEFPTGSALDYWNQLFR